LKSLHLELEHCYGIRNLKADISFEKCPAIAIYAPNGAMKSSFAQTFQDIADDKPSKDRIFPARASTRKVTDDQGANLPPAMVLVVRPYDEVLGHTEKTSTLLVNAALRKEYEQLHLEIDKSRHALIAALKQQSGSKKDIEQDLATTFTASGDLFTALSRIYDEVLAQKVIPFSDIKYDIIFDEKVQSLLGTKDFKTVIEDYMKRYNELLAASAYFKKGTFTYYNASIIAKTLIDNGFFKANHSISLNADECVLISDEKSLEDLIAKEKEGISNDPALRKKFSDLEKLLYKNTTVRDFNDYLSEREDILPSLSNIAQFKEDVWKSYLATHVGLFTELVEKYRAAEKRKAEIQDQASKERTDWEEVIDIFNARFFVPFKLEAKNRTSVMLGQEPILNLGFTFEDNGEHAQVDREALLQVLSTGEKKALYVLNIIFDVRARHKAGQSTLMVVDDIADSFDYRNKYAIIQYLKDISEYDNFYQIILTHNFDFFRTVQSRFVTYRHFFMVSKDSTGKSLVPATGIKNIFVNDWKPNFASNALKRIASIPFMRNLVEFTKGEGDPYFKALTSLLHIRPESEATVEQDLFDIYNSLFGAAEVAADGGQGTVLDLIETECTSCLAAPAGVNFENKIVLSIAVRLKAERIMIDAINDPDFLQAIKRNQTSVLLRKFKKKFPDRIADAIILDRVSLMTPENIHLNSFMYEPILDMSDEHLRQLYADLEKIS
jgi:hypothetical protein